MSDIVNDLYTLVRGKWVLYEEYAGSELGRAISEAKKLMSSNDVDAVGIIREGTDPKTGQMKDKLAYGDAKKSGVPFLNDYEVLPMANQDHAATQGSYFDSAKSDAATGDDGDEDAAPAAPQPVDYGPQRGAFALPIKIFAVAFVALGVGWAIWASISHFGGEATLVELLGQSNLAAKTMGIGFVITLVILLPTSISGADIAAAFRSAPSQSPPLPQRQRQAQKKPGVKKSPAEKEKEQAASDSSPDPAEDDKEKNEDETPEEEPDTAVPAQVAEARVSLVKFFERCMAYIMASDPSMKAGSVDAVTSFGCQLFFAGAAEIVATNKRINMKHLGNILEPVAVALGQKKERAQQFADKYESYLLEPAYLDMFRAGREAMQTVFDDEQKAAEKENEPAPAAPARPRSPADDDFDDDWEDDSDIGIFLAHALDSWREPNNTKGSMTAVLFTDIVGSTNITQKHGDEASQRMVNVHNSIVRGALQAQGGREVKHTGDGIMAAFTNPPASIDAAVDMQRGVAHYNTGNPEIELRLRVGISVGEPIAEDNDLFGTTVQTAARLCDGAGTDGIMITDLLKQLSQGRAVQFIEHPPKEFKGISEPVVVWLVGWQVPTDD